MARDASFSSSLAQTALAALIGLPLLSGCESDGKPPGEGFPDDGGLEPSGRDASALEDAAVPSDTAADASGDGANVDLNDAGDVQPGDVDAAQADSGEPPPTLDPLAPARLDCANLPTNGACQGGPREVLLATDTKGLIAMFDPRDGHFLGYFKRPAASYYLDYVEEYWFATQGPDQCIWTVSEDEDALVQRWATDGSYLNQPLETHYVTLPGWSPQPALQDPRALAFSEDSVYVTSDFYATVQRYGLDGSWEGAAVEEGDVRSLLVLGDGSLLVADQWEQRIARIPADGGPQEPVLGGLQVAGQMTYAGDGKVLLADQSSGEPLYEVEIESGEAVRVDAASEWLTHHYSVAPLANGTWLMTGGDFLVSVLEPVTGQPAPNSIVWNDPAIDGGDFRHIGRACLSEEFVASRAPQPANDTCIDPPEGDVILWEDFEGDGDFEGAGAQRHYKSFFDRGATGVSSALVTGHASNDTRALRISGAGSLVVGASTRTHKTGVFAAFPAAQPRYIRFRLYVENAANQGLGAFVVQNSRANTDQYERLAGTYVYNSTFSALESDANSGDELVSQQWVLVEMRNIAWQERTYDLYLNCKRLAEGIGLPAGLGENVDVIDLYNWASAPSASTVAYYDDILIK